MPTAEVQQPPSSCCSPQRHPGRSALVWSSNSNWDGTNPLHPALQHQPSSKSGCCWSLSLERRGDRTRLRLQSVKDVKGSQPSCGTSFTLVRQSGDAIAKPRPLRPCQMKPLSALLCMLLREPTTSLWWWSGYVRPLLAFIWNWRLWSLLHDLPRPLLHTVGWLLLLQHVLWEKRIFICLKIWWFIMVYRFIIGLLLYHHFSSFFVIFPVIIFINGHWMGIHDLRLRDL